MAEEIVKVITIDTRKSKRSIKDLKDDIKALKKELENTTIGSKDFDLKLNQLGQLQKEYKRINEEIVASSKPVQKQMFELARFGENLAKSYSAINAAMGLLSDGNEDVQVALAKTARWIQLIQGLSGFKGLLNDIPKLIDNFKGWFRWLDPVEKKIDNIASNIANIDLKKLDASGNGDPKFDVIDKKDVDTVKEYNIETEKQNQIFGDYNKQRSILNQQLQQQKTHQESVKTALQEELAQTYALADAFNEKRKERQLLESEFARTDKLDINRRIELKAQIEAVKKSEAKLGEQLKATNEQFIDQSKNLAEVEAALAETEKEIAKIDKGWKRFGRTVLSTVGWTVLITIILSAVTALWKWISGLQTAAKRQRELNKAIDEGANVISAKGIVALKELAERYKAVGDTADAKKKFLVDFKKEIEETGLAIRNVSEADDAFINNTPAYVNALKQRAKAQAIESKAVELYQEYLDEVTKKEHSRRGRQAAEDKQLAEDLVGAGVMTQSEADAVGTTTKLGKKLQKMEDEVEATLDRLFKEMFELEKKSDSYFAKVGEGAGETTGAVADTKEDELKQLKQFYDDALKLFMDARTRELQEVNDKYDEQIALAKKHNQDTTLLERAKQREIDEIIKKYEDERLQRQKEQVEEQLQVLQQQINRIRQMNDTSNLQEPQSQRFVTNYHQGFGKTFMAGSSFFYQSREDVENQLIAQVTYNNKILELTKSRIEQENALLNQQLEIEGITADRRLEIERTLRENEMALSDAAIKNEADNIAAYRSLQEKKNSALQNSLSVASEVFGAMATIAGEETEAGKAFAVTRAVIDTYAAANSAYASMAGIPYVGPALGIAAAAAAVASGIANVKTILSTKVGPDPDDPKLPTGASVAPPALSMPPIEYTRNLLGNKEIDELNKATKVYVLESDITDAQNRVKVTEDNASF